MLTKPLPGVMDDPFHPLSQGCVCHLLFNEGAGNLAYDVSGNGNHGTLKNMLPNTQGSKWQGSKFGGALDFDGQDDYINCGNDPSLTITDAITMGAWVKLDTGASGWHYLVGRDYTEWELSINPDNRIVFNKKNGAGIQGHVWTQTVSKEIWHHIALTFLSSTKIAHLYWDGSEVSSAFTFATGEIGNDNELFIGKRWSSSGGDVFNGSIDGVMIYNRALSAEEGKQLYHDPFCNLIQVPAWQLYSPAVGGLSIPVAMHHYEALRV